MLRTALRAAAIAGAALVVIVLAGRPSFSQQAPEPADPRIEKFKAAVAEGVAQRRKLAQVINDTVFSFGELAYQEVETSKYLTDVLEKNGFTIQRGFAGMPTAWVARWGSGKPVIALGSDLDCLPKTSQKPGVAYREPLIEGAPGHGEGHNSGQAVNIIAALAVKDLMEREKLPGTLMLWPGVAEELLGGKAYFVRAGMFKDVDVVLFTHVGDNLGTTWGQPRGSGMVSVEYTFEGESAHAAFAPWRGRNALRAVELMNIGWDFRREHLRPEQRSHYVITNGGDQPNVVPSLASVWYFFRELDFENIKKNYEIGNKIAEARRDDDRHQGHPQTDRHGGAATLQQADRRSRAGQYRAGRPAAMDRGRTALRQGGTAPGRRQAGRTEHLGAQLLPPSPRPESGGSDDIGDVSWAVPTVTLNYPSNIPNLPGHNWSNAIAMATPIAHKGIVAGGKVMAMTMVDLLMRPEVIVAAKTLLHRRAAQERQVRAIARGQRPAADPAQSRDHGALPSADAQVLLRRRQVRHVSGPARRQVPDLCQGPVTICTHARPSPRMTNWNFGARATAPA